MIWKKKLGWANVAAYFFARVDNFLIDDSTNQNLELSQESSLHRKKSLSKQRVFLLDQEMIPESFQK